MVMIERDQLKEENICLSSQVKRLNKKIESSEKEAKRALSALHKWGRISQNHGKI